MLIPRRASPEYHYVRREIGCQARTSNQLGLSPRLLMCQAAHSERPNSRDDLDTGFTARIQTNLRPVPVVQNDGLTTQPGYEHLLVAPIYLFGEGQESRPEFEPLLGYRLRQVF